MLRWFKIAANGSSCRLPVQRGDVCVIVVMEPPNDPGALQEIIKDVKDVRQILEASLGG